MSAWLGHLWNDPIRSNPYSLIGLILIVAGALTCLVAVETWMFRRRRKETTVEKIERPETQEPDGRMGGAGRDQAAAAEVIAVSRVGGSTLGAWQHDDTEVRPMAQPTMDRDAAMTEAHERQWAHEGIPDLRPGRAAVPRPLVNQRREACEHCGGVGYMPGVSDYLRESMGFIKSLGREAGDEVIRTFYGVLFRADPDLAQLFPGDPTEGDLGTDHKGAQQRDKLYGALAALADMYDPDDRDKMERLDLALASFGRSHAAFVRKDGTIKGATWEEYGAVKEALFQTLVKAAGEAWKVEYTESWSQAYDYAAAVMLAEQFRSGFAAPRFPRA